MQTVKLISNDTDEELNTGESVTTKDGQTVTLNSKLLPQHTRKAASGTVQLKYADFHYEDHPPAYINARYVIEG